MYGRINKPKPGDSDKDKELENFRTQKIMLFKMLIEKIKYETENINTAKILLLSSRKNIMLHTEVLKLKEASLKRRIDQLKNKNRVISDAPVSPVTVKTEEPDTQPQPVTENVSDDNTTESSSYVILMPSNKKRSEENNNKKFYVDKIYDTCIKEHFELISEDPFKILPLNRDVPIKVEYVELLKPYVLKWASENTKIMPRISLQKVTKQPNSQGASKKSKGNNCDASENLNTNIIDLTDGNSEVDKRKNECEMDESGLFKKPRCETLKSNSGSEVNSSILRSYLISNPTFSDRLMGTNGDVNTNNVNKDNDVNSGTGSNIKEEMDINESCIETNSDIIEIL